MSDIKLMRKLNTLKEWEQNPRTITKENFERLKIQIQQLGQYKPLLITEDGTVLGGNMRLKAYQELGIDEVWVSIVDAPTEQKKIEYALSDNDRVGKYEMDLLLNLTGSYPEIKWENYSIDIKLPQLVTDIQNSALTDHFFNNDSKFEYIDINELKSNPLTYRHHPADQIEHLVHSIETYGIYKNIIVAKDLTIIDGHGLVEAAKKLGMKKVPIMRLDIAFDSDEAMKILISNNEMSKFSDIDDRKLTELLKTLKDKGTLVGTGFDEQKLANLLMITRNASEIRDFNEAAEWAGMPDYDAIKDSYKVVVNCKTLEDKLNFLQFMGEEQSEKVKYIWYPKKGKGDPSSIKFE